MRKGVSKRGSSLGTIDLDETSGKPMAQQLREVLTKNAVRVVDLFREWDEGAPPHDAASNPGPTACQRAALPAPHALRRTAAQTGQTEVGQTEVGQTEVLMKPTLVQSFG